MIINVSQENSGFFQCFSSKSKLHIIELLSKGPKNIGEIANHLEVSSTIITRHITALEKAGIVKTIMEPGIRGQQKICTLALHEATLNFQTSKLEEAHVTTLSIPIGQFSSFSVEPTCGLASTTQYIGMVDDPRYFSSPLASQAGILWFESGYIDYTLPSYLFDHSNTIQSLTISLELCSEYPKYNNDFPSDILFSLNDQALGFWTSPGSFGGKKGVFTPSWFTCGTEYGLLKRLTINHQGTFIDGQQISSVTLTSLNLDNKENQILRIASPKDVVHPGGVTLFGKGFGNHNQDIEITVTY